MWRVYAKRVALTFGAVVVIVTATAIWLWNDRPSLESVAWSSPNHATNADADSVTVSWLGISSLLFDDGNTQVLIDGFFSRPTLAEIAFRRPIDNSAARIDFAMNEFRMRRLAAVIPVHSHFDHAMDVGAIANRSSASILGSESTAQIARGAGVPDDQIVVVSGAATYEFGDFTVTLRPTVHAPIGWRGSVPFDGAIEGPLETPQPVSAWRMGGSYSIVVMHPQGTVIVQGSAGYADGALQDVSADAVFLGVFGLKALGKDYAEAYWQNLVTATGAHSVYPIHFDDYTKPFGEVVPWPRILDNFETTTRWLEDFRNLWDTDTALFVPEFGKPIVIFSQGSTET